MSQKHKRTIIVTGNCQASFLARALQESPELTEPYRIVYFRDFRKGDKSILPDHDMEKCAILLEQIAHKAGSIPNRHLAPSDCKVITFPILWMNSLWPTHTKDPRNTPTEAFPAGPYPYGDSLVLRLLDQGLTPEEAAERYLETDLSQMVDIGRFHEINEAKLRMLDERADVKLASHLLDNFVQTRLFVTHNHPTMPMLRFIADRVFEALGVEPPPSDLVDASGGMQQIHMPVHPSVARHFGLPWWNAELEYRYHAEWLRTADFIRRYAAYKPEAAAA